MKRTLNIVCKILFLTILSACVDNVDNIEPPGFQQKLVVQLVLCPSDSIVVGWMDYNFPVYGEIKREDIASHGAKLSLSDGEHEEPFLQKNDTFFLKPANIHILPGNSYFLKGSDDLGHQIESITELPASHDFHVLWDTATVSDTQGTTPATLLKSVISFTDYPGEVNFYHVQLMFQVYYAYGTQYFEIMENNVYSDQFSDGKEIKFTTMIPSMNYSASDSAYLFLYFEQVNKDYYTFIKSMKNYSDSDDPFSEITPVYSNISGGLGIFGGRNLQVNKIRIR